MVIINNSVILKLVEQELQGVSFKELSLDLKGLIGKFEKNKSSKKMYNGNIKIFLHKIPGFSRIMCIIRRYNNWSMVWDALYEPKPERFQINNESMCVTNCHLQIAVVKCYNFISCY